MSAGTETKRRWGVGQIAGRVLFLLIAFVSLYLLWPSLAEVFTQWRSLSELRPQWIAVAFGVEALSFVAIWELQRIALQTRRWFPVWTSQLAGNAFGRIVPGGAATAGALQYRMPRSSASTRSSPRPPLAWTPRNGPRAAAANRARPRTAICIAARAEPATS